MLIDHHCHLDFPKLAEQRDDVVARAHAAGVAVLVTISTRIRDRDKLLEIAASDPAIYCTLGTHPHNADEELDISAEEIVRLADHPKIIGLGEAGLDYYYDNSPKAAQREGFLNHIDAARRTGLPLVIHSRDADEDMARILADETDKGAFKFVLHCYTGGMDLARRAVELGGYVSFSGVVTFKNADALREIAAWVPRDRYLVETDAPFLAPEPMRGRTNEPAFVRHTAARMAEIRSTDIGAVEAETTQNFFALYDKVPSNNITSDKVPGANITGVDTANGGAANS